MAEVKEEFLERYAEFIRGLAKAKSPQLFTNGGIAYASELMAVLFENTDKEARIFCQGFKPDLITTDPYWGALHEYAEGEPILLLKKEIAERKNDTIQIRVASEEIIHEIYNKLNGGPCNFAIFDDNKFRFENDPDGYKAFGSFNKKDYAKALITIFDEAFNKSEALN